MRTPMSGLSFILVLLACAIPASGQPLSNSSGPSPSQLAAEAGGLATALDADGVPTFIWGAGQRAESAAPGAAARWHLEQFAAAFRTTAGELASARLVQLQKTASGGYIAQFRQQVGGLDVYGSDVKVLMGDDLRLVALSGRPRSLDGSGGPLQFRVSSEQALANALSHLSGSEVSPASLARVAPPVTDGQDGPGAFQWFELVDPSGAVLPEPAPVKKILYPVGGSLVAAYDVQFYAGTADSNDSAAFRYFVAADDAACSGAAT